MTGCARQASRGGSRTDDAPPRPHAIGLSGVQRQDRLRPLAEILLMQDPSWKEGLSGQHRGAMSRRRFNVHCGLRALEEYRFCWLDRNSN
jgi:hypothetical protein